jgi:hypothetical protein
MDSNFKLKAGLQHLGCSALAFSALATPPLVNRKISQQLVSQIVSGTKSFDSPADAQQFLDVVHSMEFLQQTVQPRVPINWSNVLELKDALAAVHEQRKNVMDPVSIQNPYLRLSRLNFFKGLRSNHTVIETINPELDAVAFNNLALAQLAVAELKKMGVHAQIERLTAPRRTSTLVTSLQEIGFEPVAVPEYSKSLEQ